MRKPGEQLFYPHKHSDPISGNSIEVGGYVDPDTTLIQIGKESGYVHVDEIPSLVVALLAGTSFIDKANPDPSTAVLQNIAKEFINTFREAMVPRFRDEFARALNQATDDWDAKCRMSTIIKRYEDLR